MSELGGVGAKARVSKEYTKNRADLARDYEKEEDLARQLLKANASQQALIAAIPSECVWFGGTGRERAITLSAESVHLEESVEFQRQIYGSMDTQSGEAERERERESSDSCADKLVTARVFIGDEVDDAKTKITKEVVKLCEIHNFEQRKGRTETETERKRKFATILYMIK